MMDTFFIKPTDPASRPRDPQTGERLKEAGEEKPMNTYWLRRQLAGEVEVGKPPVSRKTNSPPLEGCPPGRGGPKAKRGK